MRRKAAQVAIWALVVRLRSRFPEHRLGLRSGGAFGGCAKSWVLVVLALGVGSCYEDSAGWVIVGVGEPVGDAS